ncbi:MAG: NADH-quinone oxidoreductase subunit L [Burkholderiaceae bacterium]|nr:NADH-quinone oxidoreductase subunit L [Burkholderiaceae bacterium]
MAGQLYPNLLLAVPLAPLAGAAIAGLFGTKFFGNKIGRTASHSVTILGVTISLLISLFCLQQLLGGAAPYNATVYTWMTIGKLKLEVGFLVDNLTVMMMCVVSFVSLMVHIYTIGYMKDDPGYNRFFAYISLFTFSMLMLVMSNNFLQLFFGWEAVGLVSYLLIGFWYTRPTAIYANMKAFLVNRVGDFGFILGIGLLLHFGGSLNYAELFDQRQWLTHFLVTGIGGDWNMITVACICLFIGAMGKSAQFPLHVWLPDSMEGPTPISALIHAATMVTAGIFMVTRMSPLFELSDTALSFVMIIGSITALFMGFLGMIQNDIKRIVAYSTLSQLGYMTVALGASAYSVAVFHLMTHAFFKALLFLAAGAVIISMHHDQDIRNMGGLRKYLPITWITSLIGSLALIGTPFFSGFYSKDSIIEAVGNSHLYGAKFASFAVIAGVFVTAFYSFRLYFLVFHGEERFGKAHAHDSHAHAAPAAAHADAHGAHGHDDDQHADDVHDEDEEHHGLAPGEKPHEAPAVVTWPLIALAIPSVVIGFMTVKPMLFGDFFKGAIFIDESHTAMEELTHEFSSALNMGFGAFTSLPFWLALAGVATAYYCYMVNRKVPEWFFHKFHAIYTVLDNKYYLDKFNEIVFAGGARLIGGELWKVGDIGLIDGIINGGAKLVGWFARLVRQFQTGYIYHYAFAMILGVVGFLIYFTHTPMFAK